MRPAKPATPLRPGQGGRGQANGDRLKLVILAGFVLFVFWGGVAVGVGFSHGHEDHHPAPPGGLAWIRNTRGQGKKDVVSERNHDEAAHPGHAESPNPPKTIVCCQGETLECAACRKHVSVAEFCAENPSYDGCAQGNKLSAAGKAVFRGATTFQVENDALDYSSVTISAWIFMEKGSSEANMKTIVSNRESGCQTNNAHRGFAFYVNEWNTADRSLNLMWHDRTNACAKLSSSAAVIKYSVWHHVGAILELTASGDLKARLYVDGELKASSVGTEGRLIASAPDNKFVIGGHMPGGDVHQFIGRIAHLAVVDGVSESLASSFPLVYSPSRGDKVKAYFPTFEGDSPADASFSRLKLVKKNEGWSPEDGGGVQISYLVPLGDADDLAAGTWPRDSFYLTKDLRDKSDALARERREVVRNAMKHAYGAYEKHAFGSDEVTPRSGQARNNWGGMAMTMVDSLDTLWIMGLKDQFYRARDYCRDRLRFDSIGSVSTFETTIRALGGLMSAFDLSGDRAFLDRARDLGERLSKAFETSSGLPVPSVALNSGSKGGYGNVVIAEVGTLQLEFRSLAFGAKEPRFAKLVENVHIKMRRSPPSDGLWPIYVNLESGVSQGGVVTFGALGDSFFEYLLKVWVQGGRSEPEYLADYERAMDGLHKHVLQRSTPSGLAYLADYNPGGGLHHKMDHLACFVGGMLALGVKKRGESPETEFKNKRDLTVAKALTYTCVQMYLRQPTGISSEYVNWQSGQDFTVPHNAPFYILRPETVESLYILHSVTGHPVYRDWGHQIMLNIDKFCKLEHGYGALPDVRAPNRPPDDRMESFFLAETLKYLFLLQDPDSSINLDEWVFNTEAHPLKVMPTGWRQKIGLDA